MRPSRLITLTLLLFALAPWRLMAEPPAKVAIIIDDLGDNWHRGLDALSLPGPVTCSILPRTPYARRIAEKAHSVGKEVMLHQPMQAYADNRLLGPGALTLDMTHKEFVDTLRENLAGIPYVRGVNNHMGSLLTRHPGDMAWLMQELQREGNLYFVDSMTSGQSVAEHVAFEYQMPTTRRNVFIDDIQQPAAILAQLKRLTRLAHRHGSALAIGHPYPTTMVVLNHWLAHLEDLNLELVPVSALILAQNEHRARIWQASLSPLLKDLKSSKP